MKRSILALASGAFILGAAEFVMMGILLYSSISKAFRLPANWTLESAQFAMAAYFMLGGAFAMQTGNALLAHTFEPGEFTFLMGRK